jgi:hypothetical protein
MDELDKENNIKETVDKYLTESDSSSKLCNFVFVLHQKIRNLQEELDSIKKHKSSFTNRRENLMDSVDNKAFISAVADPISKKRKCNELPVKDIDTPTKNAPAEKVEPPNKFHISNQFKKTDLNTKNLNYNPPVHKLATTINIQKNTTYGLTFKPKDSFLKK